MGSRHPSTFGPPPASGHEVVNSALLSFVCQRPGSTPADRRGLDCHRLSVLTISGPRPPPARRIVRVYPPVLAIGGLTSWLAWRGTLVLEHSGGLGAVIASSRHQLIGPVVIAFLLLVLVAERLWPAVPARCWTGTAPGRSLPSSLRAGRRASGRRHRRRLLRRLASRRPLAPSSPSGLPAPLGRAGHRHRGHGRIHLAGRLTTDRSPRSDLHQIASGQPHDRRQQVIRGRRAVTLRDPTLLVRISLPLLP